MLWIDLSGTNYPYPGKQALTCFCVDERTDIYHVENSLGCLGQTSVMVAPVIPISSDSSKESVGSHVPRVILFGAIPVIILVIRGIHAEVPIVPTDPVVAPEVGAVSATSPIGVLDLVDYSSSDSDPSEDSLPRTPKLPLVSPFLCSDDSEADNESDPAK
ncbi:hypothetical protein Tco_1356724 [Tanacetum coccineum]